MGLVKNLVVGLLILGVAFAGLYFISNYFKINSELTGYATNVESGKTNKLDNQEKLNPSRGILKGRVEYTIKDNNVVVNKEPAPNVTVYFVQAGKQFTNYTKVKQLGNDEAYKGEVDDVDADDSSSDCSSNDYATKRNYYDLNDNNQEDESNGEFKAYTISTDTKGCYAIKLPVDSYDIYL